MQEKPVHTCGVPQGSPKFCIKAVNKDPRQHNARPDIIWEEFLSCSYNASSAAEEPVDHVAAGWVCDASCLPRVGFFFMSSGGRGHLNSQVSGLLLDSFNRYFLGLFHYRIQTEFLLFIPLSSFSALFLYFSSPPRYLAT